MCPYAGDDGIKLRRYPSIISPAFNSFTLPPYTLTTTQLIPTPAIYPYVFLPADFNISPHWLAFALGSDRSNGGYMIIKKLFFKVPPIIYFFVFAGQILRPLHIARLGCEENRVLGRSFFQD